jgi:hypothetical protein
MPGLGAPGEIMFWRGNGGSSGPGAMLVVRQLAKGDLPTILPSARLGG